MRLFWVSERLASCSFNFGNFELWNFEIRRIGQVDDQQNGSGGEPVLATAAVRTGALSQPQISVKNGPDCKIISRTEARSLVVKRLFFSRRQQQRRKRRRQRWWCSKWSSLLIRGVFHRLQILDYWINLCFPQRLFTLHNISCLLYFFNTFAGDGELHHKVVQCACLKCACVCEG